MPICLIGSNCDVWISMPPRTAEEVPHIATTAPTQIHENCVLQPSQDMRISWMSTYVEDVYQKAFSPVEHPSDKWCRVTC
jgi:hypothetical protein